MLSSLLPRAGVLGLHGADASLDINLQALGASLDVNEATRQGRRRPPRTERCTHLIASEQSISADESVARVCTWPRGGRNVASEPHLRSRVDHEAEQRRVSGVLLSPWA